MADAPGPYASTFPSTKPYSVLARHCGRVTILFLAGQVSSFAGGYVGCGVGDPRRDDVRWLTGTDSDAIRQQLLKHETQTPATLALFVLLDAAATPAADKPARQPHRALRRHRRHDHDRPMA